MPEQAGYSFISLCFNFEHSGSSYTDVREAKSLHSFRGISVVLVFWCQGRVGVGQLVIICQIGVWAASIC